MNLYLLRHGPAHDKKSWAPQPDRLRPLTKAGRRRVKEVAKGLKKQGLSFDVLLTSPFERALETAEIVAKKLGLKKKLVSLQALEPNGNPKEVINALSRGSKKWDDVLLVGHEPYMSQFIAVLTTGQSSNIIELKKAGLAKLIVSEPRYDSCAILQLLLTPEFI